MHTFWTAMRKRNSGRPSKLFGTRLYLNCLYVSVRTINSSPRYLAQSGALHFRKAWASSGGRHVHCCANRANARSETVLMLGSEMTKRDWKRRSAERKRTTLHTLCECIYPVTATCRFLHVKRLKLLRPSQVVQTVKNTILILSGCSDWQKNTIFILSGCSERLFPSSWECR